MAELTGKVAIVTGAGRGLGRAHALALAAQGAAVVVNDLGGGFDGEGAAASPAQEAVDAIKAAGGKAVADTTDIADWDAVGGLVDTAVKTFGRLDIVVNNAGIARFGPIGSISRRDWQRTMDVNLTGTAAVCHWAAAHWLEKGPEAGRRLINTSSGVGLTVLPGNPMYAAAKAGVAALTISCALELAELGVRANAIAPAARTRISEFVEPAMMKPVAEGFDMMDPANVAALVVYLASAECAFTGRVFGIVGDYLDVFDGWTVSSALRNGGQRWTMEALHAAFAKVPVQQRGIGQASQPNVTPSDAATQALAAVEKA